MTHPTLRHGHRVAGKGLARLPRNVDVMSPEPKPSDTPLMQVLGFVAAGIGVLGFVTFFGAAILWIRYDQAALPANEAVALVPREVLLTTGASFLVPAVLLALGAVLAIVLFRVALDELYHARRGGGSLSMRRRFLAEGAFLLVLLGIEVALVAPDAVVASPLRAIALLAVGVATLAGSWLVLHKSARLLWFGVSLFAAVSVFIAATTYVRTTDRPKLEPAALLLEGEGVRIGFYIARTPDHIYVGRGLDTTGTPGGARLVAVPNSRVRQFSVGPLVSPDLIRERAARLALGLCRAEACDRDQLLAMRAQAHPED